jgi:hypothetical protein
MSEINLSLTNQPSFSSLPFNYALFIKQTSPLLNTNQFTSEPTFNEVQCQTENENLSTDSKSVDENMSCFLLDDLVQEINHCSLKDNKEINVITNRKTPEAKISTSHEQPSFSNKSGKENEFEYLLCKKEKGGFVYFDENGQEVKRVYKKKGYNKKKKKYRFKRKGYCYYNKFTHINFEFRNEFGLFYCHNHNINECYYKSVSNKERSCVYGELEKELL